jgi:hypothetical protein
LECDGAFGEKSRGIRVRFIEVEGYLPGVCKLCAGGRVVDGRESIKWAAVLFCRGGRYAILDTETLNAGKLDLFSFEVQSFETKA